MGNALLRLRRRRSSGSIRVMRMDGHVFKIRAPTTAADVLTGHPGHVLVHSEALRHLGIRATPLHASAELAPRNLYVLAQAELLRPLPPPPPRVVRATSDVSPSAVGRLNGLVTKRRCLSDVAASAVAVEEAPLRLKLRLSKAELAQLMARAAATSDDEDVASTSSSGSLAPLKSALSTIPESYKLPDSPGNRLRFKQKSEIGDIEQEC